MAEQEEVSKIMVIEKIKLRKEITGRIGQIEEKEAIEKSKEIKKRLFMLEEYKNAERIVFYCSLKSEVDTGEMLAEASSRGKIIMLPRISGDRKSLEICTVNSLSEDLEVGNWGIMEPCRKAVPLTDPVCVDLVIVPGLVFDKRGYRLGRGKGFYDRYLESLCGVKKIGLAFDLQVVDNIPLESHDVKLDYIITESRLIRS